MVSIWWKIIVLHILLAAVTRSTGLEIEDYSKLSNENIMLLFKKLFKDIENQHTTVETNNNISPINDFYHQSSLMPLNHKQNNEKFRDDEIENEILQQVVFEDLQDINSIGRLNKKDAANLCYFKICNNKKRSLEDYGNLIRYVTKNYNQQF